jgi:hypothetical protein
MHYKNKKIFLFLIFVWINIFFNTSAISETEESLARNLKEKLIKQGEIFRLNINRTIEANAKWRVSAMDKLSFIASDCEKNSKNQNSLDVKVIEDINLKLKKLKDISTRPLIYIEENTKILEQQENRNCFSGYQRNINSYMSCISSKHVLSRNLEIKIAANSSQRIIEDIYSDIRFPLACIEKRGANDYNDILFINTYIDKTKDYFLERYKNLNLMSDEYVNVDVSF